MGELLKSLEKRDRKIAEELQWTNIWRSTSQSWGMACVTLQTKMAALADSAHRVILRGSVADIDRHELEFGFGMAGMIQDPCTGAVAAACLNARPRAAFPAAALPKPRRVHSATATGALSMKRRLCWVNTTRSFGKEGARDMEWNVLHSRTRFLSTSLC